MTEMTMISIQKSERRRRSINEILTYLRTPVKRAEFTLLLTMIERGEVKGLDGNYIEELVCACILWVMDVPDLDDEVVEILVPILRILAGQLDLWAGEEFIDRIAGIRISADRYPDLKNVARELLVKYGDREGRCLSKITGK